MTFYFLSSAKAFMKNNYFIETNINKKYDSDGKKKRKKRTTNRNKKQQPLTKQKP